MMNLLLSMQENSFLIWSIVYPVLGVVLAIGMVIVYVLKKNRTLAISLVSVPALGLLYAIVYTCVYCAVTIKQGSFTYIYVLRSFEGFIVDFIVWVVLFIHSMMASNSSKKTGDSRPKSSELSEEEKIKLSNF